jgi:hypothetical protein
MRTTPSLDTVATAGAELVQVNAVRAGVGRRLKLLS